MRDFDETFIGARDVTTGERIWSANLPYTYGAYEVTSTGFYLVDAQGVVYAFNPLTGELLWELELPIGGATSIRFLASSEGNVVYVAAGNKLFAIALSE